MYFTVEEENLICLYHNADRRRTAANLRAALPDMNKEMAALALNRPLSSRQVKKEKLRHEGLVPVSKGSQALQLSLKPPCIVKVYVFVDGFLQFLEGMKLPEVVHFRFENPPETLHRAVVDAAAGS